MLLLEQYLEARRDDLDGRRLGVLWIYQVHSSGGVAITQADDLRLARAWAVRYGNGPRRRSCVSGSTPSTATEIASGSRRT